MSMNRMKLKETQVSLLLSSRAEMQKVIEKARAASSFMGKGVSASLPTPEAITNQFVTKKVDNPALPPALVTNFLQMQQQQPPPISNSYQGTNGNIIPGLGGGVTNAIPSSVNTPSMQMFYNPVDYLKLVNQQQIQMQQTHQMQQQQQQNVQKLRDPREQSRYNRSPDRNRRQRSRSPYSRNQDSSESEDKKRNRRTRFSSPEKKHPPTPVIATNNAVATAVVTSVTPQMSLIQKAQQQALAQQQQVAFSTNQQLLAQQKLQQQQQSYSSSQQPTNNNLAKSGIWDIPPPMNSYSSFNQQSASAQQQQLPTRNYQTASNTNYQTSNSQTNSSSGIGTCVKMANVDKDTTYGDIRKFFAGLAIGNNDIKFVTNSKGGSVALVRFVSSDSKKQALTKNGWQLKSSQIFITSISEDDYENDLEGSSKPASRSGNDYKRSYDDTRRERYRERSDSRERDYDRDRDYDRGGDRFNNGGNRNFRNDNRPYGRDNFNNRGGPHNGGNYRGNYRRDNSEGRFNNR
jgi:RNA-binding protein 12